MKLVRNDKCGFTQFAGQFLGCLLLQSFTHPYAVPDTLVTLI